MNLLALDIDGTLITKEHVLTEGVRSALLRAQRDYDTRIILASGRPTPALGALAEALQIADYGGYLMPFNGGKILEAGSKRPPQRPSSSMPTSSPSSTTSCRSMG